LIIIKKKTAPKSGLKFDREETSKKHEEHGSLGQPIHVAMQYIVGGGFDQA
jgi:hypothetical protein